MRKKNEEIKQRILDCAKSLIKNNEDLSMRNIARMCDITQGTIYIYFKNKNELLAYIIIDDWHKSLDKIDNLVNTCDSFSKGLVGMSKLIKSFSKPYKNIWETYKTNIAYTESKDKRHKALIDEIKEYIDILLNRFTKKDLKISNILAEIVLACASDEKGLNELETLGKVIIKEN